MKCSEKNNNTVHTHRITCIHQMFWPTVYAVIGVVVWKFCLARRPRNDFCLAWKSNSWNPFFLLEGPSGHPKQPVATSYWCATGRHLDFQNGRHRKWGLTCFGNNSADTSKFDMISNPNGVVIMLRYVLKSFLWYCDNNYVSCIQNGHYFGHFSHILIIILCLWNVKSYQQERFNFW